MRRALLTRATGLAGPASRPRATPTPHLLPNIPYAHRNNSTAPQQAFDGYSPDPLDAPLHGLRPAIIPSTQTSSPPTSPTPQTEEEARLAKARVIFGSRLLGPAERRRVRDAVSTRVAGVLVPPRPEEPDNCCMSGCAHCVWDQFRDDLEEWAERSAEARGRLAAEKGKRASAGVVATGHVAASVDEDGGGSESAWGAMDGMESFGAGDEGKDLFEGIPVGIREFMKTEKKLKARHRKETGQGG